MRSGTSLSQVLRVSLPTRSTSVTKLSSMPFCYVYICILLRIIPFYAKLYPSGVWKALISPSPPHKILCKLKLKFDFHVQKLYIRHFSQIVSLLSRKQPGPGCSKHR